MGRESTENDPKPGRPTEIDYVNMTKRIAMLLKEDRRISIEEMAARLKISLGSTFNILHAAGYKKLSTKWVPHNLRPCEKLKRVELCNKNLTLFRSAPNLFWDHLITMDETWVTTHNPESRTESMEWVQDGSE